MSDLKPCPDCLGISLFYQRDVQCVCRRCNNTGLDLTGRAPLTVADCLEVPEVRALVEAAEESYVADRGLGKLRDALAPFLAAMEGKR